MNKGTFFSAMTDIDDDLITPYGSERDGGVRPSDGGGIIGKRLRFLGPVAACVCVALLAGVLIMRPAEPQGPAGKDGSISSSAVMLPPDILRELADSDTVLRGEVLEVLDEEHANPDGTLINKRGGHIPLALVTKYRFRVDEVYRCRDDISVGDVITVATVHDVFVTEDSLDKIETDPDNPPYYLHEGQNGIFFFVSADFLVEEGEDDLLTLRSSRAAFDTVDENGIYHSKTYDLDPADLPEMYVEAQEKWGYLND